MRRPFPALALILLAACVLAACSGAASPAPPTSPPGSVTATDPPVQPPAASGSSSGGKLRATPIHDGLPPAKNIVLILTDDQRWDTLWAMSDLQREMIAPGVTFENAYVSNPLCCPSRATILTGRYSNRTGVYTNHLPYGGFFAFDPQPSIATVLQHAGYRTALIGKYLNGYEGREIPPGWDRWFAFAEGDSNVGYLNYTVNDDGRLREFGSHRPDYSLQVLTRRAVHEIRVSKKPLFLYLAFSQPHGPAIPEPEYAEGFVSGLQPHRPPSFNEEDVSDKPAWVQSQRSYRDDGYINQVDGRQQSQLATLLSVDQSVGKVIDALDAAGELEDSLIVFASDNGLLWGEHRVASKFAPYEESIRIPLVVRYDRAVPRSRQDEHLVVNTDLASTFAEAAGLRLAGVDGRSLFPLLRDDDHGWRQDFLIEHVQEAIGPPVPTYCGIHTRRWVFVRYVSTEEELYDLRRDPYQLENVVDRANLRAVRAQLRSRLARMCDPPPPGMSIPAGW